MVFVGFAFNKSSLLFLTILFVLLYKVEPIFWAYQKHVKKQYFTYVVLLCKSPKKHKKSPAPICIGAELFF
jgi:hypothetical protein